MYQSRDYKTLDGQSALYNDIITEIDEKDEYVRTASNVGTGSEVFKQSNNQDLQFRKLNSNTLTITQNANDISIEEDGKQQLDDGDEKTPSLFFTTSSNSGIFKPTGNAIGFTTNGSQRLHIHNNYLEAFEPLRLPNGTTSLPALSFAGDTNTGIYQSTADTISLVAGGNSALTIQDNVNIRTNWSIQATDANGGIEYSFYNDSDTGVKWNGANAFKMVAGNADVAEFNASKFVLYKTLSSGFQPISIWRRPASSQQLMTANAANYLDYTTSVFTQNTTITRTTSPNARYNVTEAGVYLVIADVSCDAHGSAINNMAWFWKNNSATNRYSISLQKHDSDFTHTLTCIFDLAVNEYLEVICFPFSGHTTPYFPYGTSYDAFLQFYRLC